MTTATDPSPEALRARMANLIASDAYTDAGPAVEVAVRAVPRHRFLPDTTVEDAYANRSVTIKPNPAGGRPLSCASVPTVVAMMLGQLDVQPGQSVLEIGAGTGYNAALLAHLVGAEGSVATIDIYPDVTAAASAALDATGYNRVRAITGDGALGDPEHAPFDRIIATVGPWDIPPAWIDQLAPDGRLVVPLHWRGQARSVTFVRDGQTLRSTATKLCGFIPMVGPAQDGERTGAIDPNGQVSLHWDSDQPIDTDALAGILTAPESIVWSGVAIGNGVSFDGVWLRLTATEPATCRIAATDAAVEAGLCTPAIAIRSPALADRDSLAYFTQRHVDGSEQPWELGAIGHGPNGRQLAQRICDQIRAWNTDRAAEPRITVHPAGTPDAELPDGPIIEKRHTRLTLRYEP